MILLILVLQSEQPRIEPSESCLDCICQAISSCNHSVGCTGGACGMFRITQDYWIDSDRPVPKGMNSDNNGKKNVSLTFLFF